MLCAQDDMQCAMDRAYLGVINLHSQSDSLAVLRVLLYSPCDLNKVSLVKRVHCQCFDDSSTLVVEDIFVGNKGLHHLVARRISMIIDLVLGGLSVFAQTRTNETAKRHDVEENVVNRVITVTCLCGVA